MTNGAIKIGTKIVNKANPDWGIFRITKIPTPDEDWYEKHGTSGGSVLDKSELRFWQMVE